MVVQSCQVRNLSKEKRIEVIFDIAGGIWTVPDGRMRHARLFT